MSLLARDTGQPVRPGLSELATAAGPAATTEDINLRSRILYLRSYLLMRTLIGFTGVALPVVLIAGDKLLDTGAHALRGSLSMYYYSGMRDFFVSGMSAAAGFLITYK